MVYDEPRNYIGDMHWRKDEILQDGDEFELDRSIMIQVGEALGSLEQDLTGLFEKRKKAPEVAVNEDVPHQPVAIPMARPTAVQPSQLRPKTLNALLGTPKGRIGRASLPTKSPHQLRMETENVSCGQDRPAKRQRVESRMERMAELNTMPPPRAPADFPVRGERMNNAAIGAVSGKPTDEELVLPTMRSSRPASAGHVVSPAIQGGENQMDKASKRVAKLVPEKISSKSRSSDSTTQQRKRKPDQDAEGSRKDQKSARRPEPETGYARTSTVPEPIVIDYEEDAASSNEQPRQRTKLLNAPRKSRKTLMYQDTVLNRDSRNQNTSKRLDRCKRNPMTDFHETEQARLKARLDRHQAKKTHREDEQEQDCGDAPADLFVSQEDPDDLPAESYSMKESEPKENTSKSSLTISRRRNTEPAPSSSHGSLSQEAPQHLIPRPPSTVHSTATALAKMDEIIISRAQSKDVDFVADKVVQSQEQEIKQPTSKIPTDDSHLSFPPETPPKTTSSPSPQNEEPISPRDLQPNPNPNPNPTRSPTPTPPAAAAFPPPTTIAKPTTSPTAFSKIVAPKHPPPETPITAPHPPKRKPDSLPAFVKVVPTKPRSPLKKSVSDTSAMRPPSALPAAGAEERRMLPDDGVGKDESVSLWSKEAWDLFGCGRDGVECTYEEFKRKEGLA